MKTKQLIPGLHNSAKIRVIVDGVGFHTTIKGVGDLVYYRHRVAVIQALNALASSRKKATGTDIPVGYSTRYEVWQDDKTHAVDVQVDLY